MKKQKQLKEVQAAVDSIVSEMGVIESFGKTLDHVEGAPSLDVSRFGIAVVLENGDVAQGGEAEHAFPIQSISKVFSLTMALEAYGEDVWKRVGREPSGDPFNSIIDLERHEGIPRNPFINAGALVVVDMLLSRPVDKDTHNDVEAFLASKIGSKRFGIHREIYERGIAQGFTNKALANLAKSFDNLENDVSDVMKAYVRQCSVELSCLQLALAGRYLMLGRPDKKNKVSSIQAGRARRINALMLTCGQYDGAGDFAYRVGLPAKSGIGGGILAIVPHVASIAVWSPALDENGNSLLGTIALERLSERLDWSVFGSAGADE